MKKLLILALLIVGCDYAPTEHSHDGICAKRTTSFLHIYEGGGLATLGQDNYTCYSDWSEKKCLTEMVGTEADDDDHKSYSWFNMTCDEFCAVESSHECTISP